MKYQHLPVGLQRSSGLEISSCQVHVGGFAGGFFEHHTTSVGFGQDGIEAIDFKHTIASSLLDFSFS